MATKQDLEISEQDIQAHKEWSKAIMGTGEIVATIPKRPEWESKVELIKRTIAKGCTDDELDLFLYQARRTGLDPLAKQIHAIKRWNKRENRDVMSIQTGIDGFRLIADRTGKYAGSDDAIIEYSADATLPMSAKVAVYKMVEGQRCSFSATARWDEYCPGEKQDFMWRKMPHVMLAKCAEALALRKAFPAELSGLYTFDEMAQVGGNAPHEPAPLEAATDTIDGFVTEVTTSKGVTWINVKDEKEEIWPCVARTEEHIEKLEGVAKGDKVELLVAIIAKTGKKTYCDIHGILGLEKA